MTLMRRTFGFTYVELTIVAAIVAILVAIAGPNFFEAKTRSAVSRSRSEMALLKMSIESYRLDTRAYPPNKTPGEAAPYDLTVLTTPLVFLSSLPIDAMTEREVRGENHPRPLDPIPYRYYNALQVDPENGLKIVKGDRPGGGFSAPGAGGYLAGMLWGYGPQSSLAFNPGPPATTITADAKATLLAYDPTNGTTSAGDIYQRFP